MNNGELKDAVAEALKRKIEAEMKDRMKCLVQERFNQAMDGYASNDDPEAIADKLLKKAKSTRVYITDEQREAFIGYIAAHPGCMKAEIVEALNPADKAYDALYDWAKRNGKIRREGARQHSRLFVVQ